MQGCLDIEVAGIEEASLGLVGVLAGEGIVSEVENAVDIDEATAVFLVCVHLGQSQTLEEFDSFLVGSIPFIDHVAEVYVLLTFTISLVDKAS